MFNLFPTKLITYSQNSVSGNRDCDCDCDCTKAHHVSSPKTPHLLEKLPLSSLNSLVTAYLELTPACNNRCLGCSNVFISDKPTRKMEVAVAPLSISEWRTIIHKLVPYIDRVNITGGEPTLYKYFNQFIKLLDEYKLSFTLFTNARWPVPENTVTILQQIKGLKGLLISLHGQDTSTHEAFTHVPGSYNETIKNIKLATQAGIAVTLSSIITRHSYAQSQAIYQLGQELGVHQVVFNRYIGLAGDDCAPTSAQLKQALIDIETMRVKGAAAKLSVTVPQCFHPTSATGCGAGDNFITIDPWGNVKPCNHTPMILGNLRYDSLEKIMGSSQLNYWHSLPLASCQGCSALSICGGGCRAEAMLNQNNYDSLMNKPFSAKDNKNFLILPDYLHPIAIETFSKEDFVKEIDEQLQGVLMASLDGTITLKELGTKHGQNILDLIGALHKEGVVQFV